MLNSEDYSEELFEDKYVLSEDVKVGDYIFPWDNVLNPDRSIHYKVFSLLASGETIRMRLQYMGESLFLFNYRTVVGSKERIYIP